MHFGASAKKLIEAARHWAAELSTSGKDEAYEDAERLGAPPEVLEQLAVAEDFEVHPDNWPIVELFLSLQTQWRPGMAGLDYNAVIQYLRLMKIKKLPEMMKQLQLMEFTALQVFNDGR